MAAKKEGKVLGMNRDQFRMFMGKYGIAVILFFMMVIIAIVEPSFRSINNIMMKFTIALSILRI